MSGYGTATGISEIIKASIRLTTFQDLGGQTSIRPYWRCYYSNTAAVIFVIDSTDIERLGTASEELAAMLNEEELRDAALLIFANKQDQPGARGAGDISEALQLGKLKDRNWTIVACSAIDGRGINEGMDWLAVSYSSTRSVFFAHPTPANGTIRTLSDPHAMRTFYRQKGSKRHARSQRRWPRCRPAPTRHDVVRFACGARRL